ncbi:MAG: diacylglycerol kinase family lipid kinase [Candidatus Zixiibacteriota bacterium]|nr:MAG: diacylglycerol kinase family lipid kinase [candidate division Zixibacteria bacterium]
MRYAVILNPSSGNGRAFDVLLKLHKWTRKNRIAFEFFSTTGPGDGYKLGRHCRLERFERIIVVGGDGTINEVGSALLGSNITLGIVPGGNGNDFFKMIGTNGSLDHAFHTAFFGKPWAVDVGTINNKPFFNSVGVGFDAEVAEIVDKNENVSGILAYLLAVFKALRNLKPKKVEIDLDGTVLSKEITLICIGNGRSSGGGFYLTPSALIDDGFFDICVIGALSKGRIFRYLPRTLNGSHIRLDGISIYRSRKISIRSRSSLPVHIDGEPLDPSPRQLDFRFNKEKILVASGNKNEK